MKKVVINKQAKDKLAKGFCWVYKNQIVSYQDSSPGELVSIADEKDEVLGYAYANFNSMITLRQLYTGKTGKSYTDGIDESKELWRKMDRAWSRRKNLNLDSDGFRLIWSEADGMPGLIVDCYNQLVVLQSLTAGMDLRKTIVVEWIKSKLKPQGIFERSDQKIRLQEGLLPVKQWLWQKPGNDDQSKTVIHEGTAKYRVDIECGHKTGFYLDQRASRRLIRKSDRLGTVLDCFSNTGGFTIAAINNGCDHVTAIDRSGEALRQLNENVELNHGRDKVRAIHDDVFAVLKQLADLGQTFDTVILDPPPFTKNKKHLQDALAGYFELHRQAARIIKNNGYLLTCNCAHHVSKRQFKSIAVAGLRHAGKKVDIKFQFGPDGDHPEKSQLPESAYLTSLYIKVGR